MLAEVAAVALGAAAYLAFAISPAESLKSEVRAELSPSPPLRRLVRERLAAGAAGRFLSAGTRRQLDATGQSVGAYVQRAVMMGAVGAVVFAFDAGTLFFPVGILIGLAINRLFLWRRYNSWLAEVVGDTADLITFLTVRLQAGNTVEQAILAVASDLHGPLRVEWEKMLAERESGATLREALVHLSDRVYDRDFGAVMGQLAVYDRESVPENPFANLASHISRIQMLKREYLVRRSTSSISILTGIAVFSAIVSAVAPTLYVMWVQSIGQINL